MIVISAVILSVLFVILLIRIFESRRPNSIPKIIHQTAPADRGKWNPVWFECQKSWKNLHPDFEYMFWSDEDVDDFMKTKYPKYYDMFKSYDVNIKRFDAFRYFVLYHYGGIYADMDYKCQKRFYEEIPKNKISIGESLVMNDEGYQNALMISPKKHDFWLTVFDLLEQNKNIKDVLECTGPKLISRCAHHRNYDIFSLNTGEYNPYFNHYEDSPDNYKDAKTIHMHTYSWYKEDKK